MNSDKRVYVDGITNLTLMLKAKISSNRSVDNLQHQLAANFAEELDCRLVIGAAEIKSICKEDMVANTKLSVLGSNAVWNDLADKYAWLTLVRTQSHDTEAETGFRLLWLLQNDSSLGLLYLMCHVKNAIK